MTSPNPCEDCDRNCDSCTYQHEAAESYAQDIGEHLTAEERRARAFRLAGITPWPVPELTAEANVKPLAPGLSSMTIKMRWRTL